MLDKNRQNLGKELELSAKQTSKLSTIDSTLKDREKNLSIAQILLNSTEDSLSLKGKQLDKANQDIQIAKNETKTQQAKATEAHQLYDSTLTEVKALNVGMQAITEIDRDPTLSFRLAERSMNIRPNLTALNALIRTYNNPYDVLYSHLFREIADADLSASGDTVLLVHFPFEQNVNLIDLKSNRVLSLYHAGEHAVGGRFVMNGARILTWTEEGYLHLWDKNGNQITSPIKSSSDDLSGVSISSDKKIIAIAGYSKDEIHLWNVENLEHIIVNTRNMVAQEVK